jgi:hypothetical protein
MLTYAVEARCGWLLGVYDMWRACIDREDSPTHRYGEGEV